MHRNHRLLKFARLAHLYLGIFTAPALLFFAITGGLQTFGLHENDRDGGYRAPAWLVSAGMLHKKQTTVVRSRPLASAAMIKPAKVALSADKAPPRKNLLPMKIFFAVVSFALLLSTLTGIYMAVRYTRRPRLVSALLAAGVVVPCVLWLV